MLSYLGQFYSIIDMEECMPESTGWIATCQRKTTFYIMKALMALTMQIIWSNAFPIIAIAAIAYIIMNKTRINRNQRQQNRIGGIREQHNDVDSDTEEEEERQRQSQNQNTRIEIHTSQPKVLKSIPKPTHNKRNKDKPYINGMTSHQATSTPNTPATNQEQGRSRRKSVNFLTESESESGTNSDVSYRPNRTSRSLTSITKANRKKRPSSNKSKEQLEVQWLEQNISDYEGDKRTMTDHRTRRRRNKTTEEQINIQIAAATANQRDTASMIKDIISQGIPSPMNCPAPPKFRPDLNIHEWINDINNYIVINNWDGKKKSVYWMFMDTTTRAIINEDSLDDNEDRAVEQIRERLIEIYGSQERSSMEKIKEFMSRRQKGDENVRMYSADLEILGRRAFPRITMQEQEQYVISQFIDGILNNQLKIHLTVNRPQTIKAMVDTAAKYENAFFKTRDAATKALNQNNQRNSHSNHQAPPTQTPHFDNQNQGIPQTRTISTNPMIGNYDNNRIQQQQQAQANNNLNTSRYGLRDRNSESTQRPNYYDANKNKDPRLCWHCNAADHSIRNCPTRPAAQANRDQTQTQATQPPASSVSVANI